MSKIHYFQRYSSIENTVTNNTLQLLARIYAHSTTQASQLLTTLADESIEIGIEINQQERALASVPDGTIIQRSFKILIESKVDTGTDLEQLLRHADSFANEEIKIILLLTKEPIGFLEVEIKKQINSRHPNIIFKNVTFEDICLAIDPLFSEYEFEMRALADDYKAYCNDIGLFDQSRHLMRIVPCGQSLDINLKHGIYFHPSDRGYTRHRYIGIYKDKAVQAIWSLDCVFDAEYDGQQIKKELIEGRDTNEYDNSIIEIIRDAKTECGWEIESGHRFFCGKPARTNYIKASPGGIMGARFVNLKELIGDFSDTSEVARKLMDLQWE